jgi:hypothetical protein
MRKTMKRVSPFKILRVKRLTQQRVIQLPKMMSWHRKVSRLRIVVLAARSRRGFE